MLLHCNQRTSLQCPPSHTSTTLNRCSKSALHPLQPSGGGDWCTPTCHAHLDRHSSPKPTQPMQQRKTQCTMRSIIQPPMQCTTQCTILQALPIHLTHLLPSRQPVLPTPPLLQSTPPPLQPTGPRLLHHECVAVLVREESEMWMDVRSRCEGKQEDETSALTARLPAFDENHSFLVLFHSMLHSYVP